MHMSKQAIQIQVKTLTAQHTEVFEHTPVCIGRAAQACLQLQGWRVGLQHAQILWAQGHLFIEDMGCMQGTLVNNERVKYYGPIEKDDEIVIGPYKLHVRALNPIEGSDRAATPPKPSAQAISPEPYEHDFERYQYYSKQINHIKERVLQEINLREIVAAQSGQESVIARVRELTEQYLPTQATGQPTREWFQEVVLAEICGLSVLEPLLKDPEVTEIMVNGVEDIFVERQGSCTRVPVQFSSENDLRNVIERIVSPLGRRVDERSPTVDARLADGSRVHIVLPPLALNGPVITIRKFRQTIGSWQDLIDNGTLSTPMVLTLTEAVQSKKNILISGGTGSGKTTLLNILSSAIPPAERIITIEDAAELRLTHPNLVRLEARPANAEGVGQISIRELLRNALRMRPDRIIVGECRGAEAFDMLQAMNTGHEGSLSTLHANSPREAVHRLETLVLMAELGLPFRAVRDYIASSLDYIVHIERDSSGRRKVNKISAITGMEGEVIQMEDIFVV